MILRSLQILAATLGVLGPAAPVLAQDHLSPAAVIELARAVHLDRESFLQRLADTAVHLRTRAADAPAIEDDPFLWHVEAAFGAPRAPSPPMQDVPAGLVHCVRFGHATRDLLVAHAASDPAVFSVVAALRIETRDLDPWPTDAVAVLRCSFAWDDARRIAPWTEAEIGPLLAAGFERIERRTDATVRAASGAHIAPQYGPEGFRLHAHEAPRRDYYRVESFTVVRQLSHQRVAFRVFLLSGGS